MYIHAERGKHSKRIFKREANNRWLIGQPNLLDRMAIARITAPLHKAQRHNAIAATILWGLYIAAVAGVIAMGSIGVHPMIVGILSLVLFVGFFGNVILHIDEAVDVKYPSVSYTPSWKLADRWLDRKALAPRMINIDTSEAIRGIAKVTGKTPFGLGNSKELKPAIDHALTNPVIIDAYSLIDELSATGNQLDRERVKGLRQIIDEELNPLRKATEVPQIEKTDESKYRLI